DDSFQQRKKLAQQQVDAIVASVNDLDNFTIGWSIDRPGKRTYVDFSMAAVPGSKMAQSVAALKDLKSAFGGFFDPKGMLAFSTASKFATEDAQQARQQLETARAQLSKELEKSTEFPNEEVKALVTSLIGDLFNVANGMLDSGKTDIAASIN